MLGNGAKPRHYSLLLLQRLLKKSLVLFHLSVNAMKFSATFTALCFASAAAFTPAGVSVGRVSSVICVLLRV